MGNDGGSIPTRRELVKSPTRHQTHSQVRSTNAQTQSYHWATCPLSKRPLAAPIVSDNAGMLYNKEAIIEWILRGADAFGDGQEVLGGRVKSTRDVVDVKLEADGDGKWVCPVSRKELGAGVRAVYLVPCGHVFLESAVREVAEERGLCLKCNEQYSPENVISINPVLEDDVQKLRSRAEALAEKGLTHSLKPEGKTKKRKKHRPTTASTATAAAAATTTASTTTTTTTTTTTPPTIMNATTASITTKVLQDEKAKNKRRKVEMSDNIKSLFSKAEKGVDGKGDFMSRGFTIPSGK